MSWELSKDGNVCLIDADLDSSNFHDLVPIEEEVSTTSEKEFEPAKWSDNIKVFSMSLLTDPEKSVSMSGDRYGQIINDAVTHSDWGDIDYYVVDLPAGASNVFTRVLEAFSDVLVGSVIVTHPAAETDAHRVIRLHDMDDVPILGLIENMSYFECPECETNWDVFGDSHVEDISEQYDVPVLGEIPLSTKIMEGVEEGDPVLPEELNDPIIEAADKVEEASSEEIGFLSKIKQRAKSIGREKLTNVVVDLLKATNKEINLSNYMKEYDFSGGKPINLIITNEDRSKEVVGAQLIAQDNKLKIKKDPDEPEAEIELDPTTLARIILGKKEVNDREISYSATDAWLNGDSRVFGSSTTPWAIDLIKLIDNEEVTEKIKEKYGKALKKLI